MTTESGPIPRDDRDPMAHDGGAIVLRDRDAVLSALQHDGLVPPARPPAGDAVGSSSTMWLRDAMARFSPPASHAPRRRAVVEAIGQLDASAVGVIAGQRTSLRLDGRPLDAISALARVVPTEALALCLGVGEPLDDLLTDVAAMVAVIGRGAAVTQACDAAVDRLITRFTDHPLGVVPVLSMLYQNLDATAALAGTTLLATAEGRPAAPAVPRTRRTAQHDTVVAGVAIPSGAAVTLEIGAADLPFGAGAHQCPGQALAEQIVAGMTAAIHAARYRVDRSGVRTDVDGRPATLPITPPVDRPGAAGR